jgi:hypothetical protein
MIKEKKKGKQAFRSKQFNVAGISHGVGGGKSRRILFSLFLFMITKLPVAVVGVCSPTSFDTWGPFRMSFVVAKLCGLAYGGCCGIHIAGIFYRRPNLFCFFCAGFKIWNEQSKLSSTLSIAPALSNSPQ